jgi:hypothetical protein
MHIKLTDLVNLSLGRDAVKAWSPDEIDDDFPA